MKDFLLMRSSKSPNAIEMLLPYAFYCALLLMPIIVGAEQAPRAISVERKGTHGTVETTSSGESLSDSFLNAIATILPTSQGSDSSGITEGIEF